MGTHFYYTMPDGTVKQVNPFTGTEVWAVADRKGKPITNAIPADAKRIERKEPEDYCDFCPTHYLRTPPEKERLVREGSGWRSLAHLPAGQVVARPADFRRIGNLYEIVSYRYWQRNYDYRMPEHLRAWRSAYLSTPDGLDHVVSIVDAKLRASNLEHGHDVAKIPVDVKLEMADAFFGGAHELVVARRHYRNGADYDCDLCSAGELSPEEHFQYFRFTIGAIDAIVADNRYVRYVSVFQNWLAPAGASFDHLHKQLVGIDDWGHAITHEVELVRNDPNIYNEYGANFAGYNNLVIAQNEHAIAWADVGHRFPTIAIHSRSRHARPTEHTDEEIRGVSDLVHAIHRAMGPRMTCNEEWYYSPRDAINVMPWHILIKWRTNVLAGFEGATKIYINTINPTELRDEIVPCLYDLRTRGEIGSGISIAEECVIEPNPLLYYLNGRSAHS